MESSVEAAEVEITSIPAVRERLARQGDAPYSDVRKIKRLWNEESVNDYLSNHWTLINVYAGGSGHPRDNSTTAYYVLGWRLPLPAWEPMQAPSDW